MIRLFVSDLDGCVSHPFRAPPLEALHELVALHRGRRDDPCIPPLTLCTGRPQAYAEAVAQWLAIDLPFLFESGSGMYDPRANRIRWSPYIDEATESALSLLRPIIHGDIVREHPGTIAEYAKRSDVGVLNPDPARIAVIRPIIEELAAGYPDADLEVHDTVVSVNVIPRAANKGAGVAWLAEHLGLSLAEVAYMGDSRGDLSALTRVAMPFAPANAVSEVKAVAQVTEGEATLGLVEAYREVIAHNRRVAAQSAM